jgi:adenylate cyclase, class 2
LIEIELKARLSEPEAVEASIASWAAFERSFDKSDRYFVTPDYDPARGKGFRFRIRSDSGRTTVSFKRKRVELGVETNEETEFGVEDGEALAALARGLGALPELAKRKLGRAYAWESLTLEICRVEGLGDYLEIEALLDEGEASPEKRAEARLRVLGALDRAGVDRSSIEPRPWALLLREARA